MIEKALATKPERRWATAREFSTALRGAAAFAGEAPPLTERAEILEVVITREDPETGGTLLRPDSSDASTIDKSRER